MATSIDYEKMNKANWDERAPSHAKSPGYCVQRLKDDPCYISRVVNFDIPLLGDITGYKTIHLQCHIGTDTISLARRGAASVVGLDFSPASLKEARALASQAAGGEKVSYVEASVYDAASVVDGPGTFDLVFTGIGALCWIPSVSRWAKVVASLLKPGGRLFIREGHPIFWSIDQLVTDKLQILGPYFEIPEPLVWDEDGTYAKDENGQPYKLSNTKTCEWNHGIAEIVQAVIDAGMTITGLKEHRTVPWDGLPGQMVEEADNEWALREGRDRIPLTYTLQAVKN